MRSYMRVCIYVYRVSVMTLVILGSVEGALPVAWCVTVIAGSTIDLARRDLDFLRSVCIVMFVDVHEFVLHIPR